MIINGATLRAAAISYRALFKENMISQGAMYQQMLADLAMEIPTPGIKTVNHSWLGDVPSLEEWLGPRPMSQLREMDFSITNKKFASGIEVDAEDIEDDNLGIVKPRIMTMAEAVWRHKWSLIVYLINNGTSLTGYDGIAFFSASHATGDSGTQLNYATSMTLNATNYAAKKAVFEKLKNDRGEEMGIRATHLWYVPELEASALAIVENSKDSYGADNVWYKSTKPLPIRGLTATASWGFLDLSKPVKPFVFQMKRPVRFSALDNPDSPDVFTYDKYKYGVDYSGNAGYGLWQLMSLYAQ